MPECSVCSGDFSLEDEGGVMGEFGIIPVAFCPTCLSCMCDMASQMSLVEECEDCLLPIPDECCQCPPKEAVKQ